MFFFYADHRMFFFAFFSRKHKICNVGLPLRGSKFVLHLSKARVRTRENNKGFTLIVGKYGCMNRIRMNLVFITRKIVNILVINTLFIIMK